MTDARKTARGALLCALALVCMTGPVSARSIKIEDVQTLFRISEPRISPDGQWVAYTASRSDVARNASVSNIWKVSSQGGESQQLTAGVQGANNHPRWSADGKYLYFLSSRVANTPQVFRLAVAGGEATQLTSLANGVEDFVLSQDGKMLALVSSVFPGCTDMACNEKMLKQREEGTVKARVITQMPFRRWDSWVDGQRYHLFVTSSGGGAVTDLTPGDVDSPIWPGEEGGQELDFSPDGQEIAFSRFVDDEALTGNSDLFTVPVTGGAPKRITTNKATDRTPLYSPDGRYIAYSATLRPMQETDLVRLFLYDRKTGEHRNLTETSDRTIDSYTWAPDSASLYITYENQGSVALARLEIATAKLTPLVTAGTTAEADVAHNNAFLVLANSDLKHPTKLFRVDLPAAPGVQPKELSHLNRDPLKDIQFGDASSFTYRGARGDQIQGWEIKPVGFDPAKKYPLLLLMHGGPESAWLDQFHYRWNAQVFAAAGYVVIEPNFHGSSGFGLKFQDSIKGQWGGAPYEDQMKAVDTALTWPYIDKARIAAAGASYGGYMANWVEGHTNRFRTIVSHDGLYDLIGALYSADFVGGQMQEFKGTPWQNQQALIKQAPATYAKNFHTPMLVIHGNNDYRVDPSQGMAMFQVLQSMHVPSKLLYFENENHWVLKPGDSILWYHTVLDWLDQWVKPDEADYRKNVAAASAVTGQVPHAAE